MYYDFTKHILCPVRVILNRVLITITCSVDLGGKSKYDVRDRQIWPSAKTSMRKFGRTRVPPIWRECGRESSLRTRVEFASLRETKVFVECSLLTFRAHVTSRSPY